jgi:OTU domain-containing protein 3
VIKKALENCRGNVNNAVSMLIDENEDGSISSTQGSSSVEREQDSDDEMVYGPNKRANHNRFKRASRNIMKERDDARRDMGARLAMHDGSQESVSRSMGDLNLPDSQENSPKPEADEDWQRSDFEDVPSATEAPRKIRLKINPPRSPDGSKIGKTHVRQQGPRHRPPSARERKELKKFAQKAARKQRQQQEAKIELSGDAKNKLTILPKPKPATPIPVEGGMRTLYI